MLRTNPLSDLDDSTELAEPPLVGMVHRLETLNGTRCALKAVRSAPAYPTPCRTHTLLVSLPRARLPGMGEGIWIRAATWCSWPPRGDLVVEHTVGASATARGQKKTRAPMHHVVSKATLGRVDTPAEAPARAHGAYS